MYDDISKEILKKWNVSLTKGICKCGSYNTYSFVLKSNTQVKFHGCVNCFGNFRKMHND